MSQLAQSPAWDGASDTATTDFHEALPELSASAAMAQSRLDPARGIVTGLGVGAVAWALIGLSVLAWRS